MKTISFFKARTRTSSRMRTTASSRKKSKSLARRRPEPPPVRGPGYRLLQEKTEPHFGAEKKPPPKRRLKVSSRMKTIASSKMRTRAPSRRRSRACYKWRTRTLYRRRATVYSRRRSRALSSPGSAPKKSPEADPEPPPEEAITVHRLRSILTLQRSPESNESSSHWVTLSLTSETSHVHLCRTIRSL